MTNNQLDYSQQITLGCFSINATFEVIKTLFSSWEQYEIYYSHKEKKETTLEIRFDSFTLICLFDKNNICEGSFLYPDDTVNFTQYIDYCNQSYPSNISLNGWIANNHFIQANIDEHENYLVILPIPQIN